MKPHTPKNMICIEILNNSQLKFLQVMELVDGVFIGFTMNHALADGTSFWKFASILSERFRSISNHNLENVAISQAPIFEPNYPYGYGPIIKLPH